MKGLLGWTLACLLALSGAAAAADRIVLHESDSDFEDTLFALESAIVDRGLVIDYTSHIGEMLARTGADVGSDVQVFEDARIFLFCSAVLSRKMMEADPSNIGFCPWGVFVYQTPGAEAAQVGYDDPVDDTTPADSPLHEVKTLLDTIAREAAGAG